MTTAPTVPALADDSQRGSHSVQRMVGRHCVATLILGDSETMDRIEAAPLSQGPERRCPVSQKPPSGGGIKTRDKTTKHKGIKNMKFNKYPKTGYRSADVMRQGYRYHVTRFSDGAEAFTNRRPRKDSKVWSSGYMVYDNEAEKEIPAWIVGR